MGWKMVPFPCNTEKIHESEALQNSFADTLVVSGGPIDAAMFVHSSIQDNLYNCYFSPAAVQIFGAMLDQYSAEETPPPERGDLTLLAGDVRSWDSLFASRKGN
ncbi:hypothetical protein [Roseibium sp.]|uniref:hypothetical protein n=1 Tax=Roseibium sp. TaxID=1936156 RepID=UPI003A986774